MRNCLCAALVTLPVMLAAEPASACRMMAKLELDDIKYASVVVIGRIVDYEIVPDWAARRKRLPYLIQAGLSWEDLKYEWKVLWGQKGLMSDYARFRVLVDEVLVGQAPKGIAVTWDNSTFPEPENMKEGLYLIGLRKPSSRIPPLRGPSATTLPSREPELLTVLQAPCAPAFILEATSTEAIAIREMLGGAAK